MSIADKIQRLAAAKSEIASAISQKGGTVGSGDGFEDFAAEILGIPAGGVNIGTKTATFTGATAATFTGLLGTPKAFIIYNTSSSQSANTNRLLCVFGFITNMTYIYGYLVGTNNVATLLTSSSLSYSFSGGTLNVSEYTAADFNGNYQLIYAY